MDLLTIRCPSCREWLTYDGDDESGSRLFSCHECGNRFGPGMEPPEWHESSCDETR